MNPFQITALKDLALAGGPVLIAVAVIGAMIYMAWRFMILPSMKYQKDVAIENRAAAESYASAAKSNADAARSNEAMSTANANTAQHLERLTHMLLSHALGQKIE